MQDKEYLISFHSQERLYDTVYCFLHRMDLTNPQITFFTAEKPEKKSQVQTFSRDGKSGIPTKEEWDILISGKMNAFLCVAATDVMDTRRISIAYMPEKDPVPTLLVSFPGAVKKLSGKEKRILEEFKNQGNV